MPNPKDITIACRHCSDRKGCYLVQRLWRV